LEFKSIKEEKEEENEEKEEEENKNDGDEHKNKNVKTDDDKIHEQINYDDNNKENKDIQNSEKWIWVYIWLRYSFLRQLDWQRNYNTRPALLSGAMSNLSDILTRKYSEFVKGENKYKNLIQSKSFIIKNILSLLGKGTGNGQEIRDEILKIMH
jgi:hypothetical protein